MTHELKTLPQYFQAVWEGTKTFEVRKNDRNFNVGDILVLKEWTGTKYTGSSDCVKVTYMLDESIAGIEEGYCVLGIKHISVEDWYE